MTLAHAAAAAARTEKKDVWDPDEVEGGLDLGLLKRVAPYAAAQGPAIAAALTLLITTQLARIAQPFLIALAIDRYLLQRDLEGNWGQLAAAWERFAERLVPLLPAGASPFSLVIGAYALALLIEYGARRGQMIAIETAGQGALFDLRQDLFGKLQRLSSSFYDRTPIGRLIGRVTSDIEALNELFAGGVVTILGDLLNIAVMVTVLLYVDWELALIGFTVVPVLLTATTLVRQRVRAKQEIFVARRAKLAGFLHEHILGMPIVQAFGREEDVNGRFEFTSSEMRNSQITVVRWEAAFSALTELLGSLATALLLFYGGGQVIEALGLELPEGVAAGLTIGSLFFFIDLMGRFFQPLTDLSLKFTMLQNALTAAGKVFRLMDVDEVLPETDAPREPETRAGRIEFKDVTFAYSGDPAEAVLKDVTLSIAPGEHVAVVGATGSGKSTLLKLLSRLYDLTDGSIELDGVELRDYELSTLRSRIGVVLQDVILFEGSLVENLKLGRDVPDDEAIAAGQRLHLDELVSRFPRGWHEPVAERGKNFSSGERQLIAFARVLTAANDVVVLDEATSNVDTETEERLGEALEEVLEGRTALIIAHRLSTIQNCDRIVVLHEGRVVEQGSPAELAAAGGRYAELLEQHR